MPVVCNLPPERCPLIGNALGRGRQFTTMYAWLHVEMNCTIFKMYLCIKKKLKIKKLTPVQLKFCSNFLTEVKRNY